jgi:hypothetical protein
MPHRRRRATADHTFTLLVHAISCSRRSAVRTDRDRLVKQSDIEVDGLGEGVDVAALEYDVDRRTAASPYK